MSDWRALLVASGYQTLFATDLYRSKPITRAQLAQHAVDMILDRLLR